MEHLGEDIAFRFPRVPYQADYRYDYCDFDQFPAKAGWHLDQHNEWHCLATSQYQAHRGLDGFLQAWLFFDLLIEVVRLDPPINLADFYTQDVHGSEWVTTEKLPRYLQAWKSSITNSALNTSVELIRSRLALRQAYHYASRYCSISKVNERQSWAIDPMIAHSILVLGETLSHAMNTIIKEADLAICGWLSPDLERWGYSKAVLQRMSDGGWCMHSIELLTGVLWGSCVGLLYAEHVGQPNDPRSNHSACSARSCMAYDNFPANVQRHRNGEECTCELIGPDMERLADLIQGGETTVLEYRPQDSSIVPVAYQEGLRFVILSHILADGFSRSTKNALPNCQLEVILELFERLSREERSLQATGDVRQSQLRIYFWMDTLAIPSGIEHSAVRRKAIQRMHIMYALSTCTVVLDAGLMRQSRGRSYAETAMKITMSRWITRLWTLQEAYLSKKLLFNFRDALQDMDTLESLCKVDLASPVPVMAQSYYKALLGPERQHLHGVQERVASSNSFIGSINTNLIVSLWNSLQWRMTTQAEHETLAIAILLRIDTAPFDDVKVNPASEWIRSKQHLNRKMQILWSEVARKADTVIPSAFLFLPGPKLSEKGFRWAPTSWLYSRVGVSRQILSSPQIGGQLVSDGLLIEASGYLLHRLHSQELAIESNDEIHIPIDHTLRMWMVVSVAHTVDDHNDSHPHDSHPVLELRQPAIILQEQHLRTEPRIGLLVDVSRIDHKVIYAQIHRRVYARLELEGGNTRKLSDKWRYGSTKGAFVGEISQPDVKWCVDGPQPVIDLQATTKWSWGTPSTWLSILQMRFTIAMN